jgi:DNA-binding transcriptional LysR family regulator
MRYVVVLSEELHFTRAAGRLGLAQSALSAQIRRLERHLGATLFDRTTRGTTLTPVGRAFVERAVELLADARQVEVETRRAATATRRLPTSLRLVAETIHPRVVTALADRYPEMTVSLRHDTAEAGITAIHEDRADLCHGWDLPTVPLRLPSGVVQTTLVDEPMWAVLPVDHPLAGSDRVSLSQMRTDDWISAGPGTRRARHLQAVCQAAGFSPRIRYVVDDQDMVRDVLASGRCVDIAPPRHLPDEGCRAVPLVEDIRARLFYAWQEERVPGWLVRRILEDSRKAFLSSLRRSGLAYLELIRTDPGRFATLTSENPIGWPAHPAAGPGPSPPDLSLAGDEAHLLRSTA